MYLEGAKQVPPSKFSKHYDMGRLPVMRLAQLMRPMTMSLTTDQNISIV